MHGTICGCGRRFILAGDAEVQCRCGLIVSAAGVRSPALGDGVIDPVNHPTHYTSHPSGIEVIEITEHLNFCLGNAVKYILRADHKGNFEQDIRKAIWYLERELQRRSE